jgi:uncharacterized membrane protein
MSTKSKDVKKQNHQLKENNESFIHIDEVKKLLAKQEADILTHLQVQMTQVRHAPTPPPEELRQLKQIDKSFPDRIISMAEKEQNFRHTSTYIGQINFILLVILGYGISALTGYYGAQWVGGTIALGVSYIAYVFKVKDPKPPKTTSTNKANNTI